MVDETNRGWQSGRSHNQCHQYMLENQVATDVIIKFPQSGSSGSVDKELAAHKYMLICNSPVFEAMLTGNFKEGGQTVTIPDVEPGVFMELLKFMYYDGAELSGDNVLHVMYAAKKYLIDGLVDKCKTFLETEMSPNNVCSILNHCILYDENELMEKCMEVIHNHTEDVLNSDDFLNCSNEGLHKVVLSDEVSGVSEVDIYRACVKWAKHQQESQTGSIRDILGKSLYQIRFGAMSTEELADVTEEFPGVLSYEEQCVLLRYTVRRDDDRLKAVKSMGFNITRIVSLERFISTNRFTSVLGNPVIWGAGVDKLAFMVDKQVAFNGISIFGGFVKGTSRHVTVKLFDGGNCVSDISKDIVYSGTKDPIDVKTEVPIKLLNDRLYRVEATNHGGDTYYGEDGLPSITTSGVTFTFQSVPGSHTTTARGQISQIIFTK